MQTLLTENRVEINGTGDQVVDLVFARDFANEMLDIKKFGTCHVGTGHPISVKQVAGLCAKALGIENYHTEFLPPRLGEPVDSVSLSPHTYEHTKETPYEEGLGITAQYYRSVIQ